VTTALYSGSFDPVHLGHLSVIRTASAMFDAVAVVVLANPGKGGGGLVPVAERVALLREATADLANVTCTTWSGLTVDAATQHSASIIVRSAHKELDNELTMAATNAALGGIGTGFVRGDPATGWISSSVVRRMVADGFVEDACALVPDAVGSWLRRRAAA
jgi:pantetheine-phosphate adenylyltransferase